MKIAPKEIAFDVDGVFADPFQVFVEQPWNRKPHPYRVVRDWEEISGLIDWP